MKLDIGPWRPFPHSAALRHRVTVATGMAQAGGTDASKLPAALESVRAWVEQKL
jgi:hypothetical protein